MAFTHLHVHSSYSLMDGIQHADKIGEVVSARGMNAVALTDHGYLGGIPEFVKGCEQTGVKPIIGNETYLAFGSAKEKQDVILSPDLPNDRFGNQNKAQNNGHFLLLAKDLEGYKNLLKLTHYSYTDGFYGEPRIDIEYFLQNCSGLIATSTCLSSHVAKYWRREMKKEALDWIFTIQEAVGKDNFFLEVQVNNLDQQKQYNDEWIIPWSKEFNIPLVLTADAHMANQEDYYLRGLVQCVGWGTTPTETKYKIQDTNAWMYDEQKAIELCNSWGIPLEAITNTQHIADSIDGNIFGQIKVPPVSYLEDGKWLEEKQANKILKQKSFEGLLRNLKITNPKDIPQEYLSRFNLEMRVISEANFSNYFLIVADYIQIAKDNFIPVGPGRGSSGGSLIAWTLGITAYRLDPIKNGLYFERFLNEGRIKYQLDFAKDLASDIRKVI
jgi:DNA polymerase-3 subunit alpha